MEDSFEFIPLENIKVQKHNVRLHDIDVGVEDLAENIRVNGLLQPITAYYNSKESHYVILTGQRRLNAYQYLNDKYQEQGFDKIQCRVIAEPESENKKKALSLAENITQLPMNNSDLVKAVTDLYNIYGDYKMVQQEFGLSRYMVKKYVRLARLPEPLKAAIREGAIHPNPKTAENAVLKAVDATNYVKNGPVPLETVMDLTMEIAKGDTSASDIMSEAVRGGTASEIVARAVKRPKTNVPISLSTEVAEKLQKVAETNGETEKSRATQYVVDGATRDYDQLGG